MKLSLPQLKKPLGIVVYKGPSLLTGKPVIVIITGFKRMKNPKTGAMLQSWILPDNKISFLTTYLRGQETSVCGDCKHRSVASGGWGTCYVNVHHGPNQIYRAYLNGRYEDLNIFNMGWFKDKLLRIGAYGEPAAVPIRIWENLGKLVKGWTGYTHQWNNPKINKNLKNFCMASCDSVEETILAQKRGWRTFRMRTENEPLMNKEFICPASEESGKKTKCSKCQTCKGGVFTGKSCPTIVVHGRPYKLRRFFVIRKLVAQKKRYRHLLPLH
jgi:hypothetical protein